jgi:hypothetical protein
MDRLAKPAGSVENDPTARLARFTLKHDSAIERASIVVLNLLRLILVA